MLNERKLTERELDKRAEAIQGLLSNKRTLVKKYGKDAEKVMYGIATKQAKSKVESMNKEKIKELIIQALSIDELSPQATFDQSNPTGGPTLDPITQKAGKSTGKSYINRPSGPAKFPENIEEGHGLDQDDLDYLKDRVQPGGPIRGRLKKIIDFIIKSNILQDKTKDLSVKEEKEMSDEEREDKIQQAKRGGGKEKPLRKLAKMGKGKVNEQYDENDIDMAINDLRNAADEIESAGEDAREIVRQYFPNELSRLDAYGAFSGVYSANRYDVTLGRFIDRLEEEGYEIEDGVAYVNEGHMMSMDDLDVGHTDNEPHMLKKELARAGQMIQMLYRAVDKYDGEGEVDFPQWWQKKIIQANAMLDSAFDYIDGEEMVAKIDAVIDSADEVEVDIDVVNEEDEVKKRLAVDKAVKSTLKDEGGAAGLDPLAKAVKKLGVSKDELKSMIKKIVGVAKHKHGDYISTPINEAMDGGQLFDYFAKKGYKVTERSPDGREAGFEGYMVSKGDGPYPQSVIFQYNKDNDQFKISRMGGYRIDQKEAIRAGMRQQGYSGIVGRDSYITDGNYTPKGISVEGLKIAVDHVMGGLEREASAQADFYKARGRTSGTIDEKELSKSDEKALKKIEKALKGSSKAHKSQADKISKIVKEKLTKSSSVEDHIEDFKDSDAPQFKGKSLKKIKQMALASFLSKQGKKKVAEGFKVGQKVTYLGHPAEVTKVNKEMTGATTYNVLYDKGNGKTKASNIYNKGGEIKAV